jgi:hypothetical protein
VAKRLKFVSDDFEPRISRELIKEYARRVADTLLQARNPEGDERCQLEEVYKRGEALMLYERCLAPQEFHDDCERHVNACCQVRVNSF